MAKTPTSPRLAPRHHIALALLMTGLAATPLTGCSSDIVVSPTDAPATCDGKLQDDEGGVVDSVFDTDGDGYFDADLCAGVYSEDRLDCDEGDATIHPGADEACDGIDQDCDTIIDEAPAADAPSWYPDSDEDGFGDGAAAVAACEAPADYIADGTDCDDDDSAAYPGAAELCNGADDDCDDLTDEGTPADAPSWYPDADSDGYGPDDDAVKACTQPSDTVDQGGDCDDDDNAVNPGATEICNEEDDDCDDSIDEGVQLTFYNDNDDDAYGGEALYACALPDGAITVGGDCNESDPTINPGATEICGPDDEDCDGVVDEGFDGDNDGVTSCDGDCDDTDNDVYPGAEEGCDASEDLNCDGRIGLSGLACDIDLTDAHQRTDIRVIQINTGSACDGGGMAVVTPGDFDDDGAGDVAIGVPYVSYNAKDEVGGVHFVSSDELEAHYTDLDVDIDQDRTLSLSSFITMDRNLNRCYQGGSLSPMTGVDGTGVFDALAVGRPTNTLGASTRDIIGTFPKSALSGPPAGVVDDAYAIDDCYSSANDRMGAALASIDLDADGALDLIVGKPDGNSADLVGSYHGQAQVLYGPIPINMGCDEDEPNVKTVYIVGVADEGRLGSAVGFLQGPDRALIAVSAPLEGTTGKVYLLDIAEPLDGENDVLVLGPGVANVTIQGPPGAYIGHDIADAGDVDGDGWPDLFIGSTYNSANTATGYAAFLIFGEQSWFNGDPITIDLANGSEPTRFVQFAGGSAFDLPDNRNRDSSPLPPDENNLLGFTVAAVGDIDGGGSPDLLIGYDGADRGAKANAGRVYLLLGEGDGALAEALGQDDHPTLNVADADITFTGADADEGAGLDLAPAGDLNEDGFSDFLVGTWRGRATVGEDCKRGRAYVVLGQSRP